MSTTKNNTPEATGKTFFHLEDNNKNISVSMEGTGANLVDLFANAIAQDPDIRKIIQMALMAVEIQEGKDIDPMAALLALMGGSVKE